MRNDVTRGVPAGFGGAIGHEADGVLNQLGQSAFQTLGITAYDGQPSRLLQVELGVGAFGKAFADYLANGVDLHLRRRDSLRLKKGGHVVRATSRKREVVCRCPGGARGALHEQARAPAGQDGSHLGGQECLVLWFEDVGVDVVIGHYGANAA